MRPASAGRTFSALCVRLQGHPHRPEGGASLASSTWADRVPAISRRSAGPKSALGQKLPRQPRNATSSLLRRTDIYRPAPLVRFVPETAGRLTDSFHRSSGSPASRSGWISATNGRRRIMRNHDFVSDGFLALIVTALVMLCSGWLVLAFS